MATRTWNSSGSTDMNLSTNYTGAGAILATDDLVFDNTSVVNAIATANLSVNSVTVAATYTGQFSTAGFNVDCAAGWSDDGITGAHTYGTITCNGASSTFHIGSAVSFVTQVSVALTFNGTTGMVFDDDAGMLIGRIILGAGAKVTSSGGAATALQSSAVPLTLGDNAVFTINRTLSLRRTTNGATYSLGTGASIAGTATFNVQTVSNNIANDFGYMKYTGSGIVTIGVSGTRTGTVINQTGIWDYGTTNLRITPSSGSELTVNLNGLYSITCGVYDYGISAATSKLTINYDGVTFTTNGFNGSTFNTAPTTGHSIYNMGSSLIICKGVLYLGSNQTFNQGTSVFRISGNNSTITSNGKTINELEVNAATYNAQLADALNLACCLQIDAGTFTTNNYAVTMANHLTANGGTLAMGSSAFSIGGDVTLASGCTVTGQTTATWAMSKTNATITTNGKALPQVTFNAGGTINDGCTIDRVIYGTDGTEIKYEAGQTFTLTNLTAANWNGASGSLNRVSSTVPGSAATIALPNAATLEYMYPTDSTVTGYTITATDGTSRSGTNNTGWNFGVLTATDFGDHEVFQRRKDGTHDFRATTAPILFSGSYTGTPTKIQAKVINHATSATIVDWTDIDTQPNGGLYSAWLNSVPQSTGPIWYKAQVRLVDSYGDIMTTATGTNKWGIGVVIKLQGQSNSPGYGSLTPGAPRNSITDFAGMRKSGGWSLLTDPSDWGSLAGAGMAPKLAGDLVASLGVPIGIISLGIAEKGLVGADGLYYYDVRTDAYPENGANIYGTALARYLSAGIHAEWEIFYQGERDSNVAEGVDTSEYLSALKTYISRDRLDYHKGIKIIVCGISRRPIVAADVTDASLSAIQMAQIKACNGVDVIYCPTWDCALEADNSHITAAGFDNTLSPRLAKIIASGATAPVLQSAIATGASTVRLTFSGGAAFSSATNTCFKIYTSGDVDKTGASTLISGSVIDIATTSPIAAGDYLALGYGKNPDVTTVPLDANGFCCQNYPEKATLPVSAIVTDPATTGAYTTSIATWFDGNNGLLFAPAAWGRGDGKTDKHTGTVPIYKSMTGTLVDCGNTADGYLYSTELGGRFDGEELRGTGIATTRYTTLTTTNNVCWVFKIRGTPQYAALYGAVSTAIDAQMYIATGSNRAVYAFYYAPGANRLTVTVANSIPANVVDFSITVQKIADTFRIYVNGVECSYSTSQAYDYGDYTMAVPDYIGNYNHPSADFSFSGIIYAAGVVESRLSIAERREWSDAQNHLQLYGYSNGDLLSNRRILGSGTGLGSFRLGAFR